MKLQSRLIYFCFINQCYLLAVMQSCSGAGAFRGMLLAGTSPCLGQDCCAHTCTMSRVSPWKKLMPPRAKSLVPLSLAWPVVRAGWGWSVPFPKLQFAFPDVLLL